jgi:hypothetical protein
VSRRAAGLVACLGVSLALASACPDKSGKGTKTAADVDPNPQFLLGDLRVCSVDRWCWENPMPQGNDLLAIWARSSKDARPQICAVGRDGTALHYSGHAWRREPTRVHRDLRAVWAPPMDAQRREEFIAVGAGGALLHFRDARWQWRDSGTRQDLHAIWGVGRTGFYIAGAGGAVLGCSSGGCTAIGTPTTVTLRALVVDAVGGLWAAGDGVVLHRKKGSAKQPMKVVSGAPKGVHRALYPRDGGGVYLASEGGDLALCQADRGCRALKVQGREAASDLLALAPAVKGKGALLALDVNAKRSRILRLVGQGASWRWELLQQLAPLRLAALASSGERLVAVGERAALVRFSAGIWQQEMPTGPIVQLSALWGRSANELWAVGDAGIVLHLDGRSWQRISSSTSLDLHAVAADSEGRALVVGAQGTLLSCGAKRCDQRRLPTRATLYGLASGPTQAIAVGAKGIVLRRRGRGWRRIASGGADLYAVTIAADGKVWVAGDGGRLAQLSGDTLRPAQSGTKRALFTLADDRRGALLVGGDGVLLRCTSVRCKDITPALPSGPARGAGAIAGQAPALRQRLQPASPPRAPAGADAKSSSSSARTSARAASSTGSARPRQVYGLWVDKRRRIVAVGPARRALVFDGKRWRREFTGFAGQLRTLWGSPEGHLFAAGEGGAILQHIPSSVKARSPGRPPPAKP